MTRFTVILPFLFLASYLRGQSDSSLTFFYFGPTDIGIGTVQGIHPNLNNVGFGNYINGDLKQSFRVKGIPFVFVGHISNESLRVGKPSYFRLSYDQTTSLKLDKNKIQEGIFSKQNDLQKQTEELYKLEGKLSYQREMLRRIQEGKDLSTTLPNALPDLPDSLNGVGAINLPENPIELPSMDVEGLEIPAVMPSKLDSVLQQIDQLQGQMQEKKSEIEKLKTDIQSLKEMNVSSYIPDQFQLKKANFGLTSLSSGGLSTNTIPIHGLHVEGTYKRTFYDLSAGLSQPFQNFSSQAFNQITTNTQNVFNLNQFFNNNKMRFVSSEIVGWGQKEKSHLKMEHFYSGRSWEAIKNRDQERISNTINLSGNAIVPKIENLKIGFLMGATFASRDTIETKAGIENIAYRGTATYKIERLKNEIQAEYRSLGGNYDGVSQGVIINGTQHAMLGIQQKIGRHSQISTRFIQDRFSKTDSIVLFNQSRTWVTQINSRFNRYNKFQLSYSLMEGSGAEIKGRKGHLGTAQFVNEIKFKKNSLVNILQGGYTLLPIRTGLQEIRQVSLSSDYHTNQFSYGLKGSYEMYVGIQQLWGKNYILEPHVQYTGPKGEIYFSYQYLKSQQFSEDHGFTFRASLSPSQFVTWQVTGQRWLAKERNFFFIQAPTYVAPWYADIKLIIHLNVNK